VVGLSGDAVMSSAAPRIEEIQEEVGGLGESEQEWLRNMARNDLYFLSKGVLRYKDVSPETHGAFCKFVQGHEKRRRLGLMPRGHLKSTLGTIADSLRLGLADPDNARVLIVGETAETAQKFLEEVKGHVEKNELLRQLFEPLIPTRFSGPGVKWSQNMSSLNRRSAHKEPTWQAIGVGGAVVGGHFTRIKCDDLIGFEASRSPAKMREAIDWVDNIEALLVDQHTDIIDWIGTRWSRNDLYSHIMRGYGASLAVFTREAIEDGAIIFPQKHNWEEYERIQRIRPAIWYAQYCNNPLSTEGADLPIDLVRGFRFTTDNESIEFLDDAGQSQVYRLAELDRVLLADPNSGELTAPDTAAFQIVGLGPKDEVFVLHGWSGRVSPSVFVDKIFEASRRWRVRLAGIEKAGQQSTHHYLEKKMEGSSFYVRVVPLTPKNRDKEYRIRTALEPTIRSGKLYVLPGHSALREQIATFPDCTVIDELDALAYYPEVSRRPEAVDRQVDRSKVIDLMLARRSRRTGY
jgi:hypothetical protein